MIENSLALDAALQSQRNGDHGTAAALLRDLLLREPDHPDALHLLGLSLHAAGQHREALRQIEKAIAVRPGEAMFHANAGAVALAAGEVETAIAYGRQAIAIDPFYIDAYNNLGLALQRQGAHAQAEAILQKAVALGPDSAGAFVNLGNVVRARGRTREAITHYQAAIACAPELAEAHNNLGNAFKALRRFAEALDSYGRAIELAPGYAEAHYNRGLALAARGETEAADKSFDVAIAIRPDPRFRLAQAGLLPVIPRSAAEIETWRARFANSLTALLAEGLALQAPPLDAPVMNFYLAYHGVDDRPVLELLARVFREACPALEWTAPHCRHGERQSSGWRPGGRRRVGFFSQYFGEHAVAWTIRGLIATLPRDKFEIVLVTAAQSGDGVSEGLRQAVDDLVLVPHDFLAARGRIAAAELDILIYADIGMESLSYLLAHARLAPVQCALWGHPVTTGLPTMDYFISSDLAEPPDAADHYTERLVRLGGIQTNYRRPEFGTEPVDRAALGLPEEVTLYLCPQSLFKIHPDMDAPLARILEMDPKGWLVLFEGDADRSAELLGARLRAAMGAAFDRVRFLPRTDFTGFMRVLAAADVLLDTWPFGGGNTNFQGFAAGVPIVTLPGRFLRGRGALGLYRHMEIADCIAGTPEEYVACAVRLGTDPAFRARIVEAICARGDILFDDDRVVRDLAAFLGEVPL